LQNSAQNRFLPPLFELSFVLALYSSTCLPMVCSSKNNTFAISRYIHPSSVSNIALTRSASRLIFSWARLLTRIMDYFLATSVITRRHSRHGDPVKITSPKALRSSSAEYFIWIATAYGLAMTANPLLGLIEVPFTFESSHHHTKNPTRFSLATPTMPCVISSIMILAD